MSESADTPSASHQGETSGESADASARHALDGTPLPVSSGINVPVGDAQPVGAADIADRLGVKAQTVHAWGWRGVLPHPRWYVSGLPCWHWPDIYAWAARTGRAGRGAGEQTIASESADGLVVARPDEIRALVERYPDDDEPPC